MKRYAFTVILLVGWINAFLLCGQNVIELSQPITTSATYVARERIGLLPGFEFDSEGPKSFWAYIDKNQLLPASYQNGSELPNPNRALNHSYEIGSTAGEANVTPTGAATYQIPIYVMPGTGGVQPNVALAYNSQSGNGSAGYGWNFSAVSTITRTGQTLYHDGNIETVSLSAADNLMLDGQRLIKASGTNLALNSTYHPENDPFTTVTCTNNGFTVENKQGWTFFYGSSPDSRLHPEGSNAVYSWLLKKVCDDKGNYMIYSYDNVSREGEYCLKQIDYTGNTNANLSPYNKIEFFYEIRKDSSLVYMAAQAFRQSYLLKEIACSSHGAKLREYRLNYFFDGFYSKLTEVEEYGPKRIRYNSTVIDWGDQAGDQPRIDTEYAVTDTIPAVKHPHQPFADFNGDGKTDFILYNQDGPTKDGEEAAIYLSQESSADNQIHFSKKHSFFLGWDFYYFLLGDVNGDGYTDLLWVGTDNGYYGYYICKIFQYDKNLNTLILTGQFPTDKTEYDLMVGDFDGDGVNKILAKDKDHLNYLYNSQGLQLASSPNIQWGTSYNDDFPNDRYLIDFNGNGKTDLLVLDGNGCRIYERQAGQNGTFHLLYSTSLLKNSDRLLTGDFNGDGKTDVLVRREQSNGGYEYYLLSATGNEWIKKSLPDLGIPAEMAWHAVDFNRDGKTDFVACLQNQYKQFYFRIGLFDGENFQVENHTSQIPSYGQTYDREDLEKYFHFGDFDGDGLPELFFSRGNSYIKCFENKQNLLVKGIVNGMNQRTGFDYTSLSKDAGYTDSDETCEPPVSKAQPPLYVVNSIVRQSGDIREASSFSYKGARIHRQGKGFLGFEETAVRDSLSNRETITRYKYNPTYYNVYPVEQVVLSLSGDSLSRTLIEPEYFTTSVPKVIFPYTYKQWTKDYLTGLTQRTTTVYDPADDGNPSSVVEIKGDLTQSTVTTWAAVNSPFKNRPVQQTVVQAGLIDVFTRTQTFEYDSISGFLTQQVDFYGHPKAVTTAYSNFDEFGNPQTVTVSAADCPTSVTHSIFDDTGRFEISHTDALGNTASAKYDGRTGALLVKKNAAGLTTTYKYDGFQRLIEKKTPTDVFTYFIDWAVSANTLFNKETVSQIAGSQTMWYNAAGQETKTQAPGFSGWIVTGKEYNDKGQLLRDYLPGYGSKSNQYIEYHYDDYGRLTEEINIGRSTTYDYNELTTTITSPDGKVTSTVLNTSGLVDSSVDAAGNAVSYDYNSQGKPVHTTSNGLTTLTDYDNRGYQWVLEDPNLAAPFQYEYNAYGQLVEQTNARGQLTTMTYDVAGRLIEETSPERTMTYLYVESGNGIGQIQTVLRDSLPVENYTYTALGQVASITEIIDSITYTTSYVYDTHGQLRQKQTPSGLRIRYEYSDGRLIALYNAANNALLWEVQEINALGQTTESLLGNGLTRVTEYDSYHALACISLKNGDGYIDKVNYYFDALTGNLNRRNDLANSRDEYFGYDNLDRLTGITRSGATGEITYADNGNIQSKFDVGTYQYAAGNHAVSGIADRVEGYEPQPLDVTYTSYNRPASISLQGAVLKQLLMEYGANNQRRISRYCEDSVLLKTKYYAGNYEKEILVDSLTKEYDYVYTPDGLSAIVITVGSDRTFFYVQTDHLSSIRVVTTANKSIQTRYYYDAWGQRSVTAGSSITDRGYLAQEHLDEFGLINLNARLYDPALGRFLGMDPYVQEPDFSQSHNRYSYGLNNPFKYSDPSGEFFILDDILLGALIGASINFLANAISGGDLSSGKDFLRVFGVGALAGAAGAAAGALMSSIIAPVGVIGGGLTGAAGGAASGFIGGAGNAWVNGASFGQGLKAGLTGSAVGALGGAVTGGISGGIAAYKHGGNILTGNGARYISDLEDSLFGIVDADQSPLNTNEQVNALLKEKGVDLSYYKVRGVDVESSMLGVEDNTYTYWRMNGKIYKVPMEGGQPIDIAGTTISNIEKMKAISDVYVSTHNTIPNFMKTLNHELIHAWQFAQFGYLNAHEWTSFKEASASRYTQLYYPSISVPQYRGLWFPSLYQWPKLPSVY